MSKYICRQPGKRSRDIIARDSKVTSPSLTREYSFVYKKAKGMYVWDVDGRKYLDFSASVAVMNIGHTNDVVEKALNKQIKNGIHCAFPDFYAELPVKFEEKLLSMLPKGYGKVFLSNSGTESVEAMYKLARWHTKKKWVIAFDNAFHGRTMGSLSLTKSKPVQKERFEPFLPVKHTPFPYHYQMNMSPEECSKYCLEKLEKTIKSVKGDCVAIVMEPIQGEGGYIVPPKSFVKGVRKLCDKYNILLCMDEVQAGNFRTGKYLASENFGIKPDIIALSKAIGGGIPLGATVAKKGLMDWPSGAHANTFGGNLLACAGGIATLDFMKEKQLGDNATKVGNYMLERLEEMKKKYDIIGDVRGIGLMIGVEIVKSKKSRKQDKKMMEKILCKASEKGLILLPCGESTIRICPPLIITKKEAAKGLDMLEDSIKDLVS